MCVAQSITLDFKSASSFRHVELLYIFTRNGIFYENKYNSHFSIRIIFLYKEIPWSLEDQAKFWKQKYTTNPQAKSLDHFKTVAHQFEQGRMKAYIYLWYCSFF